MTEITFWKDSYKGMDPVTRDGFPYNWYNNTDYGIRCEDKELNTNFIRVDNDTGILREISKNTGKNCVYGYYPNGLLGFIYNHKYSIDWDENGTLKTFHRYKNNKKVNI